MYDEQYAIGLSTLKDMESRYPNLLLHLFSDGCIRYISNQFRLTIDVDYDGKTQISYWDSIDFSGWKLIDLNQAHVLLRKYNKLINFL